MARVKDKIAAKAPAMPAVPQTLDEADGLIARMGEISRERARIQARLDENVAFAKAEAEATAGPLDAEFERLRGGVQAWAEANRIALTDGGKRKTVKLPSGEIAWREGRPKVVVTDQAAALAELQARGGLCVATYVEIDKQAALRCPELLQGVPGARVEAPPEQFVVKPLELPLAQAASQAVAR